MTLLYHLGFVSIASVTDKAKGKETNKVPTNPSFSIKVKHHKIKSVSGDAMTVKWGKRKEGNTEKIWGKNNVILHNNQYYQV